MSDFDDYDEFDNWFDIFVDNVRALGYNGPIDKGTFEMEHEMGKSPEDAASDFVLEMNDL